MKPSHIQTFINVTFVIITVLFLRHLVIGVKAQEPLTFNLPIKNWHISLPFKKASVVKDKHTLLAMACDGEEKCSCINEAIFTHDSSWATDGVGKRALNPCNMRVPSTWTPNGIIGSTQGSVGHFAKFDSLEHGIQACVETYNRFYKDMPPKKLVSLWTAGGGNRDYRAAVSNCYL
jgi:hypothetical protein